MEQGERTLNFRMVILDFTIWDCEFYVSDLLLIRSQVFG